MLTAELELVVARILWSLEENILAVYTADKYDWVGVNPKKPQVIELSAILRRAKFHPKEGRDSDFRSVNSVSYTINNYRAAHPDATGKGVRKTDKQDKFVEIFLRQRVLMRRIAVEIFKAIEDGKEYSGMVGLLLLKELGEVQPVLNESA